MYSKLSHEVASLTTSSIRLRSTAEICGTTYAEAVKSYASAVDAMLTERDSRAVQYLSAGSDYIRRDGSQVPGDVVDALRALGWVELPIYEDFRSTAHRDGLRLCVIAYDNDGRRCSRYPYAFARLVKGGARHE